ncbi:alpha/beta fold hydrolase [Azohydromonas lata]|uniref:Alpha/beta fold hydrolase n=1 Tax=Azohydromonas lata TaxID=45677 RepID=A0ABU5INJ2_9BURK|nr:alpha/beta fold hydrolase [Azohydromonas lata]MDZ5460449.1 alpha/beta fold hydrolase [Azohydromonas lata]
MTAPTATPISVRIARHDRFVQHAQGRLFTRTWAPEDASGEAAAAARQAAPIVLFHDSLGCVALWRDFPEALSRATGRRVVAYDRLGFGQSDPRVERPSLDFVAEESTLYFPALREHLDLQRFVALGHSVGGGMAIHCAADSGGGCEALITIAAQVFAEDRTLNGIRAAREQFQDPRQLERLVKYHGDKARWVLEAWTENWLDPGFAAWTLSPVLPRVACPVLAIHGELDEYGSTRHPALIGALCGGPAQVDILPGVGHVPHREVEGKVLELIRQRLGA